MVNVLDVELKNPLRKRTPQLEDSDDHLTECASQLEVSESHLAERTSQLQASEGHLAERTSQLEASESHLAERSSQLEASESHLAERSSQLEASERRKQMDQDLIAKLNNALSGRTVLLQEVHHRVKNNLAVIAALLGMQADVLKDERAIAALGESQRRVESMALIHEYLYGNEHLDRVNFGRYIERLTDQLSASYAIEPDLVSIRIVAEEIDLPIHQAIPCGLIINELVSNALKYAYPRPHCGEISIQFVRLESGKLSLSCQDKGVGIPETFDWKNASSFGLRIIQLLTKQLNGELKLDRSGGTRFELHFSFSD